MYKEDGISPEIMQLAKKHFSKVSKSQLIDFNDQENLVKNLMKTQKDTSDAFRENTILFLHELNQQNYKIPLHPHTLTSETSEIKNVSYAPEDFNIVISNSNMQHSNSDEDLLLDNILANRQLEYEQNYPIAETTEPDDHNSIIREGVSGVDSLILGASQNDDVQKFVIQTPIVLVNQVNQVNHQVRSTQPETTNPETDLSMEAKYKEAK